MTDKSIVLIGMPGVGKSTVGVLLAKTASRPFIDTDVYIQAEEGRRLQELLDTLGREAFCTLEERHILALHCPGYVIATGGSVVYSQAAMEKLGSTGVIVHLDLPLEEIESRIANLDVRGVVMAAGKTLRDVYRERQPLYERYADITIPCTGRTHEQVVDDVLRAIERDT